MVVIFVEAANGHLLFAAPQLALDVVVFPAVAGFQPQSAVGPELIKLLSSAASAGLWNFPQPLTAMAGIVDVPSGTRNRPAAIQRFQAIHDSGKIFDDGQITSG